MGIHRTMIGGQAVMEGVMMRGVKSTAMAVRKPDGTIDLDVWRNNSLISRHRLLRLPVVRGIVGFVEQLISGYRALMKSAELATLDDETEEETDGRAVKAVEIGSMIFGVVIAIFLFAVLPSFLIKYTDRSVHWGAFKTIVEGVLKIAVFVGYLAAISRTKEVKRLYQYHGAEHKTIYCYEHGDDLTPENARKYTRFHPRCGTSFILIAIIIGILVFSFVTWKSIALRVVLKLILTPLVIGISYEIIKFAGRHDNSAMRIILAPGLWLQRLTTSEPDDSQLEVAIKSLNAVLTDNPEEDRW